MEAALTVTLAAPDGRAGGRDCYRLEQRPWPDRTGIMDRYTGVMSVNAAIALSLWANWPTADCGIQDGAYLATVYGYPCAPDLAVTIGVSRGAITSQITEEPLRTEVIRCDLQDTVDLGYPARSIVSVDWIGDCYDPSGGIVPRPEAVYRDGAIRLSAPVYGSLRVRYRVLRQVIQVSVPADDRLDSVVYARWDGGVAWLEIDPPPGAEAAGESCGNGLTAAGTICATGYDKYPVASRADRYIAIDYCSQQVISDETVGHVDYGGDTEDCP